MSGLDRYLEPPSCRMVEVELAEVVCDECGVEQDATAYTNSDEAEWQCGNCETFNTAYWDDDPVDGSGWKG